MKVRVVLSVAIVAIALVSVATGGVRVPPQTPQEHRRIGMFIGISKYADPAIPRLVVCDKDAEAMARVMKQFGRLDKAIVLLNEEASRGLSGTSSAINWSMTHKPATRSSSTGPAIAADARARTTDSRATSCLLNGRADNTETMLMDDTFGSWMLGLRDRRVVVILDAAYAFVQTKAGQGEFALLASGKASQQCFERTEGDLGVMTYFLVQKLEHSGGQVTVKEAFNALDKEVPRYVEAHFPGSRQAPVLIDETTIPTYLRP